MIYLANLRESVLEKVSISDWLYRKERDKYLIRSVTLTTALLGCCKEDAHIMKGPDAST